MAEISHGAGGDLFGRVLDGRYAIEGRLGEGGIGVVYRATQTRLGRPVAVKVLHGEHAKRSALRERFEREARSLARLAHPNIVDVIDYGIDGDSPFLVMELLEGRPLDVAIRNGLTPEEGLAIGHGVVAAVAYAHGRGVVHRDLKPGNIFLQRLPDGSESPRVLDFGLAKFVGESTSGGEGLTKTGAILGTPAYMSPEQATGASSDVRADVYSLGIVLYELLTGNRPFIGPPAELLRMHLLADLPPLPSGPRGLPDAAELDAILRRATEKSASKRYADAGKLLEALEPFAPERPARTSGPNKRARAHSDPLVDARALRAAGAPGPEEPTFIVGSRAPTPVPAPAAAAGRFLARAALLALGLVVIAGAAALALRNGSEAAAPAATPTEPLPVAQALPPDPPAEPEPPAEPSEERTTAAGAAAAGAAVARALEGEPAPAEAAPPVAEAAPAVAEAAAATGEAAPPAAHYELPPELAAIERRYRPGARLAVGDRTTLFRYSSAHRDDPRAWLLMAHLDFENGARSDALRFYGNAVSADPGAIDHPTMLRDLVIMSAHGSVGGRASSMVEELWGRDAIPAIDAAMRDEGLDADEMRRLGQLKARLLSMEAT